jgi:hypothetical protein
MGKRVFSTNVAGKLHTHMQKKEVEALPILYTKMYSKWIKDLNIRTKTVIHRGEGS